ncbi:MAG: lysoplasmalogenase [Candidatus Thorarchaeota archaeon]
MDALLYGLLFWTFSIFFILLSLNRKSETKFATAIKMIPAVLASIFVLLSESLSLFYIVLVVALVFCALGDVGMEINVLQGLGLFLIAQIVFTSNFLMQSILLGIQLVPLVLFVACCCGMLIYVGLFHRYIQTAEEPISSKMQRIIDIYALVLSLTLCTSLLIWVTSGTVLGFIPFIGACLFVVSDSLIGVREFHHHFKNQRLFILSTYYLAIFLLSLSAVIYAF